MNVRRWAERWIPLTMAVAVFAVVVFYLVRFALDIHGLRHGIYGKD